MTGFPGVSVVCAAAQSVEMLIACRASMGALSLAMPRHARTPEPAAAERSASRELAVA